MEWKAELAQTNADLDSYRAIQKETAAGFTALHRASMKDGVLSRKEKELMALAIGIARQCADCIGFHVKAAIAAGASRDEVAETVSVSIMMGGGPAYMYGAKALAAYDQFTA